MEDGFGFWRGEYFYSHRQSCGDISASQARVGAQELPASRDCSLSGDRWRTLHCDLAGRLDQNLPNSLSPMKILYVENHAVFAAQVCQQFLSAHVVRVVPTLAAALETQPFGHSGHPKNWTDLAEGRKMDHQ